MWHLLFLGVSNNQLQPFESGEHLTLDTGRSGSCRPGDLPLPAGAAGRLACDGPPWLAAVPVQSNNLTGPRRQLPWGTQEGKSCKCNTFHD